MIYDASVIADIRTYPLTQPTGGAEPIVGKVTRVANRLAVQIGDLVWAAPDFTTMVRDLGSETAFVMRHGRPSRGGSPDTHPRIDTELSELDNLLIHYTTRASRYLYHGILEADPDAATIHLHKHPDSDSYTIPSSRFIEFTLYALEEIVACSSIDGERNLARATSTDLRHKGRRRFPGPLFATAPTFPIKKMRREIQRRASQPAPAI